MTPAKNLLLFKYKIWSCIYCIGCLKKLTFRVGGGEGAASNPGIIFEAAPVFGNYNFFLEVLGGI
jgi:hypothetical protein